jgi:type IV pilus assembly protein PilE
MKKFASSQRGMSLIELLIVVAIVGILAAIAYPSYQDQIIKSQRSDGQGGLLNLAARLEKYLYTNGTYSGATVAGLMGSATTPEGFYTLSLSAATASNYEIRATPVAGTTQANDSRCNVLIYSANGNKNATGSCAGASSCAQDCW